MSLTNAMGKTETFAYDTAGNLTRETSPRGYTYNYSTNYAWNQGRLASRTDANGRKTSYTYDALGRLTRRSYLDGSGTTTAYDTYTYDYLGNLTEAYSSSYGIRHTFTYNGQGMVTDADDTRGYSLDYTYNPTNTRASMNMVWQGQTVSYSYDENDRLTQTTLSGSPARWLQFQYDDAGRRTRLLYFNGVYSLYNYNSTSKRLSQILHYTSTNSFLDGYSYGYNNVGNITAKTTGTASLTYTYNNNYRLTDSSLTIDGNTTYEHFTYDAAGNRLSGPAATTTYSYDDDDRMATAPNLYSGITYDNNGNLTGRTKTSTGEVWTYAYDYENRLIQAVKKVSGVTKIDSTFKYDALGRRVYRKVVIYGPPATEEKEFTYIYDGFDLIQERVSRKLNGVTQPLAYNTYVHGPGVDEPLYLNKNVNGVSSDFYFHADALGSITSITNVNQVIAEFYSYTSFGEMTRTGGVFNKFLFTGRELDEETGLYYYRVRYLDPASGRFTSKDPIGFAGGVNKYVYVQNNPVNLVDPWGLAQVVFDRSDRKIYVYPGDDYNTEGPPQVFPAGNDTIRPQGNPYTQNSYAPLPEGTFPVGNFVPTGNNPNSPYGNGFFPIILPPAPALSEGVHGPPSPARTGTGIHSGRANRGGPNARTLGCLRTTDQAIDTLKNDPPTTLSVIP